MPYLEAVPNTNPIINYTCHIYRLYQALTLDVIGETAFGMECDAQRNPNDFLLNAAKKANDYIAPDSKPFIIAIAGMYKHIAVH